MTVPLFIYLVIGLAAAVSYSIGALRRFPSLFYVVPIACLTVIIIFGWLPILMICIALEILESL